MKNKKVLIETIIGVIVLVILVIGASFSYFSITNTDSKTTTNFFGETESMNKYGTAYLQEETEDLHINLKLSDLAPGKIGTKYYATKDDEDYLLDKGNHAISSAGIANAESEDLIYNCTSTITIKASSEDALENVIKENDGKVYLGFTSTILRNKVEFSEEEIDLKKVIDSPEGYVVNANYVIIGNNLVTITGDIKIENREADQNAMAGKNINIDISNENLSCVVGETDATAPEDFEFYIKEQGEDKYTNEDTNKAYLKWIDNDVASYCITEGDEECVWQDIVGDNITETTIEYAFKDTQNGEKELKAYLKDVDENVSLAKVDKITLDKSIPVLTLINMTGSAGSNEGYTISRNIKGTLEYSDEFGVVDSYCLMDSATSEGCKWLPISENIDIALSEADGEKSLFAYVKDKAGNISNVKESNSLIQDTGLPLISEFTISGNGYVSGKDVKTTIKYSDNLSGVKEYCIQETETSANCKWISVTKEDSIDVDVTLPDNNILYAYVKDKAGNISLSKKINEIISDNEKPKVTSLTLKGESLVDNDKYTKSKTIQVTIGYSDDVSGVKEYCLMTSNTTDGCTWLKATGEAVDYVLSGTDGVKTIYAFVKDNANNISETVAGVTNKSITLDTTNPTLTLTLTGTGLTDLNNYTNNKNIKAKISPSDNGSGAYQYCLSKNNSTDGCDWTEVTTSNIDYSLSLTADGSETVYAFVRDKAGNVSASQSKAMTLDTSKPTVTLTLTGTSLNDAASNTREKAITAKLTYSDTGSGVHEYCLTTSNSTSECSWKTATTENIDYTLNLENDGTETVNAYVRDKVGNISAVSSKTMTLDTSNPTVTLTLTGDALTSASSYTKSQNIAAKLTYDDDGSGVYQYCLASSNSTDGCTWTAITSGNINYKLKLTTNGSETVYAFVRDKVGNVSTVSSKSITLDTSSPTVTLTLTGDALTSASSYTKSQAITAKLTYSDTGSSGVYQYCLTNATSSTGCSWKTATTEDISYSLTRSTTGNEAVNAYVRDKAGNVSAVSSKTMTLDKANPTVDSLTLTGDAVTETSSYTKSRTITAKLTYSDDDSGVYQYCLTNATSSTSCSWKAATTGNISYTLTRTTSGSETVYAYVRDNVGNVSTYTSKSITLDVGKPTVTLALTGNALTDTASNTSSKAITAKLTYSDTGSSGVYQYCLNKSNSTSGCTWTAVTTENIDYTLSLTADGDETVYAFVRDKAGNVSIVSSKTMTLDTGKPTVSLTLTGDALTSASSYTKSRNITAKLTYGDGTGTGVYQYCLTTSSSTTSCSWKTATTDDISYTLTRTTSGSETVYAFVRDKVGNVSTYTSGTTNKSITLDVTNPTLSSVTLKGTAATTALSSQFTSDTSITATLSYSDANSGVYQYCSVVTTTSSAPTADSACTDKWNSIVTSYDITLASTNGTKYVHVYVRDRVGNISTVKSSSIILDTTKPVVNSDDFTLEKTSDTQITATITKVTEDNVYQYCFRNGASGEFSCGTSNTASYTVTSGQTYTIYAYVIDKAGNNSSTLNKSITTKKSAEGTQLEGKEGLTSDLVGGMYRYQGTTNVNNYICLGASCNTNSINEEDMYRIIGITQDGQIKVIKKTAMKEGTTKSFKWHTSSSGDTQWPDSDLFHRLNDNGSGTYATTSFYSKLDASVREHIDEKHLWNYGDTSDTVQYNGDFYYGIETGTADASHRIKNANDNDYTTEKYKWNTSSSDPKKEAPIGLMYVHDYLYAYPDGKTDSYSNLKNAWIFLENNDDKIYNKDSGLSYWYEWTMTRYGYYSGGLCTARLVLYNGIVSDSYLTTSSAVRPVFYLESDIKLSGEGSLSNPYKI